MESVTASESSSSPMTSATSEALSGLKLTREHRDRMVIGSLSGIELTSTIILPGAGSSRVFKKCYSPKKIN